ncbi:uncharacterized protein LOC124406121 [Diprion similis]|uniref:uncharacterized protein LOC124406121 n=1 Tax=Diprion similis TaxID=362088 RepID=UPI001EF7DCA5|nr:uncharacterized protein LOC124406121 [Diprion similis]
MVRLNMVTIATGAVVVGICSVCAIPVGCFISRRFKKKVITPEEVPNDSATGTDGSSPVRTRNERCSDSALVLSPVIVAQCAEMSSRSMIEVRVIFANGSKRSSEAESQGYVSASGSPKALEERRDSSLQHPATRPATSRREEAASNSLPVPLVGETVSDDTTRLEITISGGFAGNVARFVEFKKDLGASTSTPNSRLSRGPPEPKKPQPRRRRHSGFWRRTFGSRDEQSKVLEASHAAEDPDPESISGVEMRSRGNLESQLDSDDAGKSLIEEGLSFEAQPAEASTSCKENRKGCSRWGLPARLLETLKESTSLTSL